MRDQQSFSILYKEHAAYLGQYLRRHNRTLSHDTIEDIIHDVFYSIWIRRSSWNPDSIPAYLTSAVKKRVIDHLRYRDREEPLDPSTHQPVSPPVIPGEHSSQVEQIIEKSISRIPDPIDREIARHHFYEHLTPGAIVKILKIRNGEVRQKIAKAREHIAVDLHSAGIRTPLQRLNKEGSSNGLPPVTRSPYQDRLDLITRMSEELERNPRIHRVIGATWGPISLLGEYTSEEVAVLQELSSAGQ